jgi:hypothetical protein
MKFQIIRDVSSERIGFDCFALMEGMSIVRVPFPASSLQPQTLRQQSRLQALCFQIQKALETIDKDNMSRASSSFILSS